MSNHSTHSPRFPIVRRFWKPAVVTGAGGTALAIWFEEIAIFAQDILALIFRPFWREQSTCWIFLYSDPVCLGVRI